MKMQYISQSRLILLVKFRSRFLTAQVLWPKHLIEKRPSGVKHRDSTLWLSREEWIHFQVDKSENA